MIIHPDHNHPFHKTMARFGVGPTHLFIGSLVLYLLSAAAFDGWSNESDLPLKVQQTERPASMTPT